MEEVNENNNNTQQNDTKLQEPTKENDNYNNKINEENLNVLEGEADDYMTNLDVGDPKYCPKNNININATSVKENNDYIPQSNHQYFHSTLTPNINNKHNHNFLINTDSNYNELFAPTLHDKLLSMKADIDVREKLFKELVDENLILKNEIINLQETLSDKLDVINDFQNTIEKSGLKFKQLTDKLLTLQKQKEILLTQINDYENEIHKQKLKNEELESLYKSSLQYQEQVSSLQNEFNKKETNLTLKHKEKENELRIELTNEIAKLTQQNDDLKIENEKLKSEISTNKIQIETYMNKLEEKENVLNEELIQKNKEIQNQTELINEYEQRLLKIEKMFQEQKELYENDINKIINEKEEIITELNDKKNLNINMQSKLNEISQQYESLFTQFKEYKLNTQNKENVITQLKQEIESMNNEILARANEFDVLEKNKNKELREYDSYTKKLLGEKSELEKVNYELSEYLNKANEKIKELTDLLNNQFHSLKHNFYNENNKCSHLENRFKGILHHLKQKEQRLIEENSNLKDMLNDKEIENEQLENHYQNQLKNVSFRQTILHDNCNSNEQMYNNTNNSAVINRGSYNLNSFNVNSNIGSSVNNSGVNSLNKKYIYDDQNKEAEQRKTLENFKKLLNNIDEKLNLPE